MNNKFSLKLDKVNKLIKINNSEISIVFNYKAYAVSLKYNNTELLNRLSGEPGDPDKTHSFYCDYHMNGKTRNIHVDKFEVIEDTDKTKHIVFKDLSSPLGIEYHFILRSNDPAVYSYVVAWNNLEKEFSINELRTVYRMDRNIINIGHNMERTGCQPSSKEMQKGEKLQDETYRMKNGSLYDNSSIYSKYDYAGYYSSSKFWGQHGNSIGVWLISPDHSYYASGPLNQDLMIHYDGIILNYLTSEHFGKGIFTVPKHWKKMFGPWVIYLNDGNIEDAAKRSNEEENKYPYPWLLDSNYPHNLFTLKGKIKSEIKDTQYNLVLLSEPINKTPILQQKNSFSYFSNSDVAGNFCVNKIRPGNYWLYAYSVNSDDLRTHFMQRVAIKDSNVILPTFHVPTNNKTIWQIGKSTHTTDGFKYSDQLRNFIWKGLVPQTLDYTIGKSHDWYYLQNSNGKWNIHFSNENIKKDRKYILEIALAGTTQKDMTDKNGVLFKVTLNKESLIDRHFSNDRSAYRSAVRSGAYHLLSILIDGNKLLSKNTITLKTNGYVMYDTIRFSEKGEN